MKLYETVATLVKKLDYKRLAMYGLVYLLAMAAVFVLFKMKVEDAITPYETYVANNDEEQFVRNLTTGMTIEQDFTSPNDFQCITLSCSDHEMSLPGKLIVEIRDTEEKETVVYQEIENSAVHYGVPVEIAFDGKGERVYQIKITALDTGEDAIGFYGYLPEDGEETANINGEPSEYALSMGTHIYSDLFSKLIYGILIIAFIGLLVLMLFLCKGEKNLSPERIFLFIAIPMGVALLCFQSVNFIHDGDAHFFQSYHYSNELLGKAQHDNAVLISMRQDDVDAALNCNSSVNSNARNMSHIIENWSWFAKDAAMVEGVQRNQVSGANIIEYLPSVLGITLARLLKLGTYPMILLAKISPFITYLICCYYAIRITPVGKRIMVLLAALPMSLQQATGITYDNFAYMVLFLMIALTLKVYYEGINRKLGISLSLLCIALSLCKGGVYMPMLLLLLFIPREKMGGLKRKLAFILITGCLTLLLFLTNYSSLLKMYLNPVRPETETAETASGVENNTDVAIEETSADSKDNTDVEIEDTSSDDEEDTDVFIMDQRYGMSYALKEPVGFIKLVLQTLVEKMEEYYRGVLGRVIAWPAADVPAWSSCLFGILLLLSIGRIGTEKVVDGRLKAGMLLTFFLVAMAHFVIFCSETTKGTGYIWGLQGRYFIPLLLLPLLCIRNNHASEEEGSLPGLYVMYDIQWIFYLMGYYIGKGF